MADREITCVKRVELRDGDFLKSLAKHLSPGIDYKDLAELIGKEINWKVPKIDFAVRLLMAECKANPKGECHWTICRLMEKEDGSNYIKFEITDELGRIEARYSKAFSRQDAATANN